MKKAYMTPVLIAALLTAVYLVSQFTGNVSTRNAGINLLIYVVIVVGFYVFVGPTGLMSFGHASFMAIGAYAAAVFALPLAAKRKLVLLPDFILNHQYGAFVAIFAAAFVAAIIAGIIGPILMRLNGLAAGIATLALLIITNVVISQSTGLTGGPGSLVGVPVHTSPLLAWIVAVLAVMIVYLFQISGTGLKLRASRDDALAAMASGVKIHRLRSIAFILSAVIVAIGGALFAMRITVLSPVAVYLDVTFMMIAMLVIGGLRSLSGAVIGVITISIVSEIFRNVEAGFALGTFQIPALPGLSQAVVALLLLTVLIIRPKGILGDNEFGDFFKKRTQNSNLRSSK